ncbi:MAG: peptidoglycan DD-metalloendopeptidase family protein [candidate division WOR-3 bacterium]|nr:M23 family metallopeptidase [candidate division WOR-3 bacterium]MDW8150867.1 peptidoglycan DD-metalloendopeptidase family protein [candidate division WOR-3 bacterium]
MKKFIEVIILDNRGNLKRYTISKFKLNVIKALIFIVVIVFIMNVFFLFLNFNDIMLIKENYELKKKLAEFKKLEKEIEEFRRIKNTLYLALGLDSEVKDTMQNYNYYSPDLLEQVDTPIGLPASGVITQEHSENHIGVDIALNRNSFVFSTAVGKVEKIDSNAKFGLHIVISHNKDYKTLYAHLSRVIVSQGDSVKRGQVIGYSGSSGHSTGPHLHYEVWKNNKPINPLSLIR